MRTNGCYSRSSILVELAYVVSLVMRMRRILSQWRQNYTTTRFQTAVAKVLPGTDRNKACVWSNQLLHNVHTNFTEILMGIIDLRNVHKRTSQLIFDLRRSGLR